MNNYFKIKVKHRTQSQWLIWLMIIITFFLPAGIQFLHFPTMIKYGLDILWILLVFAIIKSHLTCSGKDINILFGWIIVFFIITIINYCFNYQSIFYYLWGFRNNFRFYILFIACTLFMKEKDAETGLELFDKIFWVNSIICFIQYFGFQIKQDNLGGIFGVEEGCNGALNLFFVIIVTKSIVFYLNKKESFIECLLKCGLTLVISAFAELKFFYIEFAVVIIIAILITKFTFRKLFVIIGAILGLIIGISLLINIFPYFEDFFTIGGVLDSATNIAGYTSSGDMNRLTGISIINERFLEKLNERMFGLGLGNCDYSAYNFLNSPFYLKYSELHYTWLSTAWIYLENGFVGIVMFFGFFIAIAIFVIKRVQQKNSDTSIVQLVFILSVCCVLIGIYNSSLRAETAYLVYFVLSMAFWKKNNLCENKLKINGVLSTKTMSLGGKEI